MEECGWEFYGMTRVNTSSIDSLFFKKSSDEDFKKELKHNQDANTLSVLSLNRTDRLRLIEFDQSASNVIKQALTNFYEKDKYSSIGKYHGAIEFKLRGSPFNCCGIETVDSHRLICSVLQSLSCEAQYNILTTIKVSDKVTSKSSFIMRQSPRIMKNEDTTKTKVDNAKPSYACISLSEKNKLRLINLPVDTTERVIKIVSDIYEPGMIVII